MSNGNTGSTLIIVTLFMYALLQAIGLGGDFIVEKKLGDNPEINESIEANLIYEITSLETNNSTGGQFFLGTGSISETTKYAIMAKVDGGYTFKQVNAEDTIIIEDNDETPRYIKETITQTKKNTKTGYERLESTKTIYKLYIPENSIDRNYSTKISK